MGHIECLVMPMYYDGVVRGLDMYNIMPNFGRLLNDNDVHQYLAHSIARGLFSQQGGFLYVFIS